MNRKLLAGAAALVLPASLLGVTAAGATAKAAPKPVITGVTVTGTVVAGDTDGGVYPDGIVGFGDTVSIHVTGTNLNVADETVAASSIKADVVGAWTINAVGAKSTTGFIINATAPGATLYLAGGKGYPKEKPDAVSGGGAVGKFGPTLGSNCGVASANATAGVSLPYNANTGTTYQDSDFGGSGYPESFKSYLESAPTLFTNVGLIDLPDIVISGKPLSFGKTPLLLCAEDLGNPLGSPPTSNGISSADTLGANGYYVWANNYPLYFLPAATASGTVLTTKVGKTVTGGNGVINNIAFSLPYTSETTVAVTNDVIVYNVPKGLTVGGCRAATSTTDPSLSTSGLEGTGHTFLRDSSSTTCAVGTGGKTIIVTDPANHSFSAGDFLDSPAIDLTGVSAKTAGAYHFTLASTTATIALSGETINIGFDPAAKSSNASAAAFTVNA